jgi:hypothetical protein
MMTTPGSSVGRNENGIHCLKRRGYASTKQFADIR